MKEFGELLSDTAQGLCCFFGAALNRSREVKKVEFADCRDCGLIAGPDAYREIEAGKIKRKIVLTQ